MHHPLIILLDIEGTVAPVSFVHEVLFPYARREMRGFLLEHWDETEVVQARQLLQPGTDQTVDSVTSIAHSLMDRDVKDTGLKQLQGLIWDRGYRSGAFRSPVFEDVPRALKRMTSQGKSVAIYSSGSIAAQKVFFQHTDGGDLTPLLSNYFDTTSGSKRDSASYINIASRLAAPVERIMFITDMLEEAIAANAAGMTPLIALRAGNAPVASHQFGTIASFDAIEIA